MQMWQKRSCAVQKKHEGQDMKTELINYYKELNKKKDNNISHKLDDYETYPLLCKSILNFINMLTSEWSTFQHSEVIYIYINKWLVVYVRCLFNILNHFWGVIYGNLRAPGNLLESLLNFSAAFVFFFLILSLQLQKFIHSCPGLIKFSPKQYSVQNNVSYR